MDNELNWLTSCLFGTSDKFPKPSQAAQARLQFSSVHWTRCLQLLFCANTPMGSSVTAPALSGRTPQPPLAKQKDAVENPERFLTQMLNHVHNDLLLQEKSLRRLFDWRWCGHSLQMKRKKWKCFSSTICRGPYLHHRSNYYLLDKQLQNKGTPRFCHSVYRFLESIGPPCEDLWELFWTALSVPFALLGGRCESTHGQALKLLSSAKEMEDSIAVNLR